MRVNDGENDLAHGVRSGDFVVSLLKNARDPSELAFAIGALSHYIGYAAPKTITGTKATPSRECLDIRAAAVSAARTYGKNIAASKDGEL